MINDALRESDRVSLAVMRRELEHVGMLAGIDGRPRRAQGDLVGAIEAFRIALNAPTEDMAALDVALLHGALADALHAHGDQRGARAELDRSLELLSFRGAEPHRERAQAGAADRPTPATFAG